jgi:hypothetical protein
MFSPALILLYLRKTVIQGDNCVPLMPDKHSKKMTAATRVFSKVKHATEMRPS